MNDPKEDNGSPEKQDYNENNANSSHTQNFDQIFHDAYDAHSELYQSAIQQSPMNLIVPPTQTQDQIKSIIKERPKSIIDRDLINQDSHQCADFTCLLISVFLIFGFFITFIVVYVKGSQNNLKTIDSNGIQCGSGSSKAYPYLYMNVIEINGNEEVFGICVNSCPNSSNITHDISYYTANPNSYNDSSISLYSSVGYSNPYICIPTNETLIKSLIDNLNYQVMNVRIDELDDSFDFFLILMAFSIIISFSIILLFRLLKAHSIYTLVFLVIILLLCLGVGCIIFSVYLTDKSEYMNYDEYILEYFSANLHFSSGYLILGIVLLCYTGFYIVQMIYYYKTGDLSKLVTILKTVKDINQSEKLIWILGLVSFILIMIFFVLFSVFYIYLMPLYSSEYFSINFTPFVYFENQILYRVLAYLAIPVFLWILASIFAFSQFCFALFSVTKYFPVRAALPDHKMSKFSNKLNYHCGSVFFAGLGIIVIFISRLLLGILISTGSVLESFSPKAHSWALGCQKCYKNITEKFSGHAFVFIALSNSNFFEASETVSRIIKKNYDTYKLEGDIGEILSHLCGLIVFCLSLILGLAFGFGNIDLRYYFWPFLVYGLMAYFCGLLLTQNYWFEIDIIYILFCIHEEIYGKREENQYNYGNSVVHGKLNEIGGSYRIMREKEQEQFAQGYSNFH